MRNRSVASTAGIISLVVVIFIAVSWIVNINKLIDCDFEAPYKAEVIHSIGLVPIISVVTAWVDVGR